MSRHRHMRRSWLRLCGRFGFCRVFVCVYVCVFCCTKRSPLPCLQTRRPPELNAKCKNCNLCPNRVQYLVDQSVANTCSWSLKATHAPQRDSGAESHGVGGSWHSCIVMPRRCPSTAHARRPAAGPPHAPRKPTDFVKLSRIAWITGSDMALPKACPTVESDVSAT